MNIEFTIPRVPLSPNRMLRMHWATRRKDKIEWILWITAALTPSERTQLRGMARKAKRMKVRIKIYKKTQYFFDPDNLVGSVKHCLDAIRLSKFLKDDSAECLKLKVLQGATKQSEKPYTVIQVGPEE